VASLTSVCQTGWGIGYLKRSGKGGINNAMAAYRGSGVGNIRYSVSSSNCFVFEYA
jgi:hypothetical protein